MLFSKGTTERWNILPGVEGKEKQDAKPMALSAAKTEMDARTGKAQKSNVKKSNVEWALASYL